MKPDNQRVEEPSISTSFKEDEIGLLTKGTFMGSYKIDQQKQACANWVRGSIPANFLDPVRSDIPTLIVSGNLDPVTPIAMAKEIATHLQNSTVIVIPEMSHMPVGLGQEECFNDLFISFLKDPRNPKMNLGCIEEMKPPPFSVR